MRTRTHTTTHSAHALAEYTRRLTPTLGHARKHREPARIARQCTHTRRTRVRVRADTPTAQPRKGGARSSTRPCAIGNSEAAGLSRVSARSGWRRRATADDDNTNDNTNDNNHNI